MRLGNLFKAVVKTTVELPISIVKDVFIGVPRIADGKNLYSKDKVEEIADELNKITDNK